MITLDLPETLEKHFWHIVRDSYHGDLQAAVTAFLKLHEKYGWKEQFVKDISVAERSFSFLDRVQMFAKPMPQPLLHGSRQLQDKVHKTQGLEDFKMASGIRDDMCSTATKLFKRQRVTRLVRKTDAGLRVGKQMVEAIAQDHRRNIKHDLTVAR